MPAEITREWVAANFDFGSITWNGYYEAYTVTFETAAYHNGELAGTGLRAELLRDSHQMLAQDTFNVIRFDTADAAREFCQKCGVCPYSGKVIYKMGGEIVLQIEPVR
jgi:hypothetical protein